MRVPIRSFAVVGICLSIATALSQQTPSQEPKASDPEGSRPQPSKSAPSRPSPYYDRRERAAATMTFEWESVGSRVFSREYVQWMQRIGRIWGLSESPEDPPETPTPSDPDVSEIDEKNLLLEGLRGTCRIERTPNITRVRLSEDLASISDDGLRKSEEPYQCTVFYLGKTGEAVISSFGDPSPESVVHIAFAGAGGIGLPDPILAGVRAEMLVFLGGVSPLRMFGCAPEDWKLVEVSEEAWVFEFDPDEEQRKKMAELSGFGKARVRLNRAYDDAPEQIEIFWRGDRHVRWTTEAYRRVNDSWMPSRVLHEWSGTDGTGRYVYELVAATPSAPIRIDIPEGTPVSDWRLVGRALWRGEWDESRRIKTQWSPELLRDIWRQIQRESGNTTQDSSQK
jgi:hypothetical protein